jgi:GNAT superfamily N-acetyltransferase
MEITKASVSDIPDLCRLLDILFSQELEFSPDQSAQVKGLSQIIENPEIGHIIVAKANGNIVGMVNVLFTVSTALGGRVAIFEDMVVMPGARSAGIGSQLLEGAIQSTKLSCCKRVTLLTDRENTSAQRFYAKHGFSQSTMIPLRLPLV